MQAAARAAGVALVCAALLLVLHGRNREPHSSGEPHGTFAVWVFLHPDSARSDSPAAISPAAAAARRARGIPIFDNDRPLPRALVNRIARTGALIRQESRWLRAVSVDADRAALARLVELSPVISIQPVGSFAPAGGTGLFAAAGAAAQGEVFDSMFYGPNFAQMRMLGVPAAHASTFTGKNVVVAILDGGFETRHEVFAGRTVEAARDFINGDAIVYDQPSDARPGEARHGTQVWSLIGGFRPGSIVGPGYDARFILAKVDAVDSVDTRADEDRWIAAVEWADSLGARLIASALTFRDHYTDRPPIPFDSLNGDDTRITRMADEAARRLIVLVTAMGDGGPGAGSLATPADGDSVIAVGAADTLRRPASFPTGEATGEGPTADGRRKPEVLAPGTRLFAASSLALNGYDGSLFGTSYATALMAGASASFMEAWSSFTPAAVRSALMLAGDRSRAADNQAGSGVPDLASAILFPNGLTPVSILPIDLGNAVTSIVPAVAWTGTTHPLMGPVRYRVEFARDSLFQNIFFTDTVTAASALTVRRAVRPATTAWWRVIGTDSADRHEVRRASRPFGPFSVPRWVRLTVPDPSQVTQTTLSPEFRWTPLLAPQPIGPLLYDLEIRSFDTGELAVPAIRGLQVATHRLTQTLLPNRAYRWRVIARTQTGQADTVESTNAFLVASDSMPPATLLYQNFPNPFPRPDLGRNETQIWFDLAEQSTVELVILDLGGRLIRRLIPAEPSCGPQVLEPGLYGRGGPLSPGDPCVATSWDGRDADGRLVETGIYLLRLRVGGRDFYRRAVFRAPG
jgi:subtilisin family serine protease